MPVCFLCGPGTLMGSLFAEERLSFGSELNPQAETAPPSLLGTGRGASQSPLGNQDERFSWVCSLASRLFRLPTALRKQAELLTCQWSGSHLPGSPCLLHSLPHLLSSSHNGLFVPQICQGVFQLRCFPTRYPVRVLHSYLQI